MLSWAFGSDSEKKSKPKVLPPGLAKITHLLTDEQVDLMVKLCSPELDQKHLFEHWPTTEGVDESPAIKKGFVQQLEALDKAYPKGGLAAYIKKSRALVQADKNQAQLKSLDHWKPTAPLGQTFELGTEEHEDVESIGMREVHSLGFVLLASGVKLGLQSELATGAAYLGLCIRYVLALQMKHCKKTRKIPLCVITSEDQKENLLKIFEKNKYFGLLETQVTILTEPQRMPAFIDSSGKFAIDPRDPYKLLLVPHGNGDVHKLLHTSGVADKWYERGTKWISVIADTNALAYHTIPLALGVSIKHDLIMNTTAIPRKANEETGAIMKLIHKRTDETWTVHAADHKVLDGLLRNNGAQDGETADDETGLSAYPRFTNQILFKMEPYLAALENSDGVLPEFIHPKYADDSKSLFKEPVGIEVSMHDFSAAFVGSETEKVGYTCVPPAVGYSPVVNTLEHAATLSEGVAPGVLASAEADIYAAYRNILKSVGCEIEECEPTNVHGVTIVPGPQIVVKPEVACCISEYKKIFTDAEKVKIKKNSSLVLKGPGKLTIESLLVDGALVVDTQEGGTGVIRDLTIANKGWTLESTDNVDASNVSARGYVLKKKDTSDVVFKDPSICAIM